MSGAATKPSVVSKAAAKARPYILPFSGIGSADLPFVGGKGANLGELVGAGIPVPNGFCVSARAYADFLEATGVAGGIDAELAKGSSIDELSARICDLIGEHELSESLTTPLLEAYRALGRAGTPLRVAVRSSATAEDLPGFSFAGQQDTYLGITGEAQVLQAVRKCWQSLWTPRAISYRQTHGFRHQDVLIAVVIQEMFPSEISGVLFTANPLTGSRNQMVANGSWGLGEAIVSGLINPDHWTLERKTGKVLEQHIGDKLERIDQSKDGSGVVHMKVPGADRNRPSLTPAQLAELVAIGRNIEAHYGYPQDIEWGYAGGRFAVLQAREITGVEIDFGEELDTWNRFEADDEQIVWSRAWADAFQTAPTTPLMYSIQQSFIARSYDDMYKLYGLKSFLRARMYRWHRTRPYYSAKFEEARLKLMPKSARTDDALAFIAPADWDRVRAAPFEWWKVAYAQVHAMFIAPRYSFWQCADTFYKEFPDQVAKFKAAMAIDFDKASYDEIMKSFRVSEDCFVEHALSTTPGIMDYCYFLILALSDILRRWAGDADQSKFGALLSGLSTRTVVENAEIWRIARRIPASKELTKLFKETDATKILNGLSDSEDGRALLAVINEFLAENGHRGGSERDAAFPRWGHRPELFINALRALASGDESNDPEATEAKMVERRERTTAEVEAILKRQPGGFFKVRAFRWVLRWALKYVRMRDDQRYYADYYMGARYDFFMAIGNRLVERGLIGEQRDVFFLGLEEIDNLWHGKLSVRDANRRIAARRKQHEKYEREAPPFYMRGGLPILEEADSDDLSTLKGIPASSGRIHGRARVCKTLEETSRIEKGDILVAAATDPGWTPVFSIIGAVVIETGGPLAHATLVSREYGIPCVTNVSRATEKIIDGEMITVDGNAGLILLDREQAAA